MKVPDAVNRRLRDILWGEAERLGWTTMSDQQKSALYEDWLKREDVGQVLSRYLDPGSVRVYIKDTIMKPFVRYRIKDITPVLAALEIANDTPFARDYIKPHGRLFRDGRVICWGLARDWKDVLFSVVERALRTPAGTSYAAVLLYPSGKVSQPSERGLINEASRRLGIQRLCWRDE
jgi:hypothetical protein